MMMAKEAGVAKGRTAKSALTLIVISLLTKPLGFLKEIIIAAFFGATAFKDAFIIAWAIPNMIASFVIDGLNQVLVPMFVEKIHQKSEQEAWKIASVIGNLIIASALALALLVAWAAPWLVPLIAPNVSMETKLSAIGMTRILSFTILALAASALLTSILNAYRRFVAPALTFGAMNLIIIVFVLVYHRALGIYSLVFGTLLGAVGMVIIQLPPLFKEAVHYRFNLDLNDQGVRHFGRLMAPMIFGTMIFGLMTIIEKIFASGLPVGSISSLDYGFRVMQFVFTLFVPTITTAAFPTISLYALDRDRDRFIKGVWSTIKIIELFVIPIAIYMIGFNYLVVKIIYERGAFGPEVTLQVSKVLSIYAFGLFVWAATWILFYAFHALKDTIIRFKISLVILAAYVLANLALTGPFGVLGIAAAFVLAWSVGFGFLLYWFIKEYKQADLAGLRALFGSLVRMVAAALLALLVVKGLWSVLARAATVSALKTPIFFALSLGYLALYGAVYLLLFKDREVSALVSDAIKGVRHHGQD